jgi:hypothetical protein
MAWAFLNSRANAVSGIKSADVIAIDTPDDAAGDEREDESIREYHSAGTKRREDAVLDLVEEVGGVHQREGQPSNRVFRQQLIDVAANKIGTPQTTGLYREPFGFEPFL